jgi:hypothetical protein
MDQQRRLSAATKRNSQPELGQDQGIFGEIFYVMSDVAKKTWLPTQDFSDDEPTMRQQAIKQNMQAASLVGTLDHLARSTDSYLLLITLFRQEIMNLSSDKMRARQEQVRETAKLLCKIERTGVIG